MDTPGFDFLVRKDALHETKIAPAAEPTLAAGQVLAAVDRFAFTANNVTYAVFGEMMQYWHFFPAPEGWGRIPVWGFADVVGSECPEVPVGERLFGYWPMSTHAVLTPTQVTAGGFHDATAHRAHLHALYNAYTRVAGDPGYDPAHEDEQMLLRVLFLTGFLIDDFLADNQFFGARSVVIASASSKTAIALAHCLHQHRRGTVDVVGLTSPRNMAFTGGLGCYDRVVAYENLETLPTTTPIVFVDMSGDGGVVLRVHTHFGDALRHSCVVGGTHWDKVAMGQALPGVQPALFFAPDQVAKRTKDWGAAGLQQRMGSAWKEFLVPAAGWVRIVRGQGPDDIARVYQAVLSGGATPDEGHVLSPR
ncbi:MAG TPA: DUF2855 family protein [Candidatus Binatia bacterium]|jgi:hypothetical protein|nr:DUF2855 family protein [Candidatus Binatia bacterium]